MSQPLTIAEAMRRLRRASGDELAGLITELEDDPRERVRDVASKARRRLARERSEETRLRAMYERTCELGGNGLVVGIDEVGRGAVAGPLTVAAVALPMDPVIEGLNDSKQLTARRRSQLAPQIRDLALALGVYHVPPTRIDVQGMARSIREAMDGALRRAVDSAGREPDAVLIDGRPVGIHPREVCVVKGDATIAPIAAASIVAKVTRDAILTRADEVWPGYVFAKSKGYASAAHIAAIRDQGLTPYHRRSFCAHFIGPDDQPTLF